MNNLRFKVFCLIGVVGVCFLVSPAHAKNWYDYYREAKRAILSKDGKAAVPSLEKAIAEEPGSSRRKKYAGNIFEYYPYLYLGWAYLLAGDAEAAYQSCEQEQQQGAASQKEIDDCLTTASQFLGRTPVPPSPTPMPIPPTPIPRQDTSPSIELLSVPPAETDLGEITIEGIARGTNGIKKVRISRANGGVTWSGSLYFPESRAQEMFNMLHVLEPGPNEFTIEAVDTTGQVGTKVLTVVKTIARGQPSIPTPELSMPPIREFPTPTPLPPTPTPLPPTLPLPQRNIPPSIQLISDIPAETGREILEIQGIVFAEHGIEKVNVSIKKPGTRSFIITPADLEQKQFKATVQLDIGQNEIAVEASDTSGQAVTKTFMVVRKAAQSGNVMATAASPDTSLSSRNVYAVIIGIGNYQDPHIPALRFTVNDAKGVYDLLTNPDYGGIAKDHIALLLDQDATVRKIKGAIGKWISQQAKADDTVLIYYAGHGAPEGGETYWVTYDANIDDLYTTALSNNEIADMLSRVQSKRVVTFLDSCYSAATVNRKNQTRSIPTEIPWEKFAGEGRVTISASDGKQQSLELDEYQHGVFTYYLLEGLEGKADKNHDGVIEVDEIWDYLKYQVTDTARKNGNSQTPVFQGSVTAGIPLTFNKAMLEAQQQFQASQAKQEKLKTLFKQKLIAAKQYNCAYKMLRSGITDPVLESLLADELEPDVFNETFECPLQK
jgi:hypothetical protein